MANFTVTGIAKLHITAIIEAETEEEAIEQAANEIYLFCHPLDSATIYGLPRSMGDLDHDDDDIEWTKAEPQ